MSIFTSVPDPVTPQSCWIFCTEKFALSPQQQIADIGSGTGILSKLFLDRGNAVIGVEPNAEMRTAGDRFLSAYPKFKSIDAPAEATTLPDSSIDLIVAGQAFHWFDPEQSAIELGRICKPTAHIALIWNERRAATSGFDAELDRVVEQFTNEPHIVKIRGGSVGVEPSVEQFFGSGQFQTANFDNYQRFDFSGLLDRVYSSSYMPLPGDERTPEMEAALRTLFDQFAIDGQLQMNYETRCLYGKPRRFSDR